MFSLQINDEIKRQFSALDSTIKTEAPDVIIWGYTAICKQFLHLYSDYFPQNKLTVWDRFAKSLASSDNGFGYQINYPEPNTLSEEFKRNGYVLLAFLQENHFLECEKLLKEQGVINIIKGSDFRLYWCSQVIGRQYDEYTARNNDECFKINPNELYIFDHNMFSSAGMNLNDDYVLQDLWGARKVYQNNPQIHYDIGSSVVGFITHLLSFDTKVVLIDIRPLNTFNTKNLSFICSDATNLSNIDDESIESLSALCSLEHFGLGRYGDPIDPEAHKKAFHNIQRVMKPGGNLYISVPIAKESRLVFNAHRIYAPELICSYLDEMELVEFSYTSPKGLTENVSISDFMNATDLTVFRNHEANLYNTGLFYFRKR